MRSPLVSLSPLSISWLFVPLSRSASDRDPIQSASILDIRFVFPAKCSVGSELRYTKLIASSAGRTLTGMQCLALLDPVEEIDSVYPS